MSDTPTTKVLKVIPCYDPTGRRESCGALVQDTDAGRKLHRDWHAHDEKVKNGLRDGIKQKDELVRELLSRFEDVRRDVDNIPEPPAPIEINQDGWADDEDDDDQPVSTYADDDLDYPDTRTDATTAFTSTGFTAPIGIA